MSLTKISGEVIQGTITVGVVTATRIDGDVSGNVNSTGVSTFSTLKVGTGVTINSGIVTATTFSGNVTGNITGNVTGNVTGNATGLSGTPNITVGAITASSAVISGNVSVAGTITYEDTTNVDSIGVITARNGVVVSSGNVLIGTGTSTGTASQLLQVTGGAYVSGNLGLGASDPFQKLHIQNTTSPLTLNLKLNNNSTTNDYAEIAFQLWSDASSGETVFGGSGTSRPSGVIRCLNENGSSAAGSLIFATFSGGSTNSTVTEKMRIDSSGRITAQYQPCFLASRSGSQTYSANNAIIFNLKIFDQGSNYNSSTGVFTAPVTGRYLFLSTVLVQGTSAGNEFDFQLSTSNREYYGAPGRTETQNGTSWGDGYIAHATQQIADMDAGDTAYIRYTTFGGGSIYGGGGGGVWDAWSKFSGYLLC